MNNMSFIEEHIIDNMSKEIFYNRRKYNAGDISKIDEILQTVYGGKELLDFFRQYEGNLYIFGAGILGKEFLDTFWGGEHHFRAFIDNDIKKQGTYIKGLPVIGIQELPSIKENIGIVLVNKFQFLDIKAQLLKCGFNVNQIFNFSQYYLQLNYQQYFDIEYIDKKAPIDFVDCGALDGNTSIIANKWFNAIENIWVFEPDKKNIEKCKENLTRLKCNIEIVDKAVWSCNTTLNFNENGNGMSGVDERGEKNVEATYLDAVLRNSNKLYIKMDIEGAELQALQGTEKIIKNCKPNLAICVYHKTEDIEKIPMLLLKYYPEYKFCFRHYSLTKNETVLYAIS